MVIPTCRTRLPATAFAVAVLFTAGSALALTPQAAPEATGTDPADGSRLAVVTANDVYVRSGPADSYYPFGKLRRGDVVKVVGEKPRWARIATAGPAFRGFFGYIRYPRSDAERFELDETGRRGRTLGLTRVLAPNLNTGYEPNDSWRRIHLLDAGVKLSVLETTENDRLVTHKIVLPAEAEGWISLSLLEPAPPEAVAAWTKALRDGVAATAGSRTADIAPASPPAGSLPVLGRDEPAVPDVDGRRPTMVDREGTVAQGGEALSTPAPVIEPAADDEDDVETWITPAPTEAAPPPRVTRTPAPARAVPAPPRHVGLDELEAAYERLRAEPIRTAEVLPLRDLYRALAADRADEPKTARFAAARAEQLTIWSDLQQRRGELDRLRKRLAVSAEQSEAVRVALEATGLYVAVGRLATSTVYDGTGLPRLFRVQDTVTGRTVAYLRPDDGFDLYSMLGQIVGVVGDRFFEEDLRLTLVKPRRIDLLSDRGKSG